ncbi:Proteophosphoglycan 5 [Rhodotorula toruloides ATCC 204091]|uniref:Proteophosphoglycan 5 n=2 Tax=Rhodotorula toruloides TaxID=5286 RepID=A0A2T0AAZ6_RHOTO|nr:Proteophosphoglycan 5 [Rhodotorula toruloides ATCC 204091]KAK4334408.1 hypothetical protein RTBOTA2_003146 [Rhodotorula toruloides]PRQ75172.1 Proteophosphoglycan 5 [Rhodotorula toruloides]
MPPLSLAQTLPPELLTQIFGLLVRKEVQSRWVHHRGGALLQFPASSLSYYLRDTALVCRAWQAPSQRMLFRFIDFSCCDLDKLAAVVTSKPNLAAGVYGMCAGLISEMDQNELQEFPKSQSRKYKKQGETACRILAACGNIRHVDLRGFMREILMRVLGILDSLELESLVVGQDWWDWDDTWRARLWFPSPNDITILAQKPSLRILDLRLWTDLAGYGTTLPPRPTAPTSFITTLSLTMHNPTFALRLLHEVSNTLVTLKIHQFCAFTSEHTTSVFISLRKLEVIVLKSLHGQPSKWLEPALPHLPALRRLDCDFNLGAIALQSPAPTLRHITCSSSSLQPSHASLRAMVDAASSQTGRLQIETISLGLGRDGRDHAAEVLLQELRATLEERGTRVRDQSPFMDDRNLERHLWFN